MTVVMANAADALRMFEAQRSHPPCKAGAHVRKLERNTYLEWLDDELLLLRLHKTYIARFVPHGVILNFEGWRTKVTFERAERFTPLRTIAMDGLHFVVPNDISWREAREQASVLFTDGITIHCDDGTVTGAPMPSVQAQLVDTVTAFPRRVRRWCERCVRAWDRFEWEQPDCEAQGLVVCAECPDDYLAGNGAFAAHALKHIDEWGGTPVPLPNLDSWAERAPQLEGDELCKALCTKLYRTVREQLIRKRLAVIDESFVWMPAGRCSQRHAGRAWHDPFNN